MHRNESAYPIRMKFSVMVGTPDVQVLLTIDKMVWGGERFWAGPWRHLSYLTSTYSTWCCFSFHWVHGHLKSLTGY